MRTAICFAGHLRNFDNEVIYQSNQENLLNPLRELGEVDIFFSTWDKLNTQQCFSVYDRKINIEIIDKPVDVAKLQILQSLYKPVAVEVESFEDCYDFLNSINYIGLEVNKPTPGYNGMLSLVPQLYKVYKANLLKKKAEDSLNLKYDMVIRFRPDWIVKNKWPESFCLKENALYIPAGYVERSQTVEDHFAYGHSDAMDIYSDLYSNLKEMFNLGIPDPANIKFLYHYLKKHKINVSHFDLDFQSFRDDRKI